MIRRQPRGFTLVELLVVITIIGILMSLMLPAVNAVRENGRRVQCTNNLYQLSRGFINHEATHGIYPTGGWGYRWVGDPDRGVNRRQPGGWGFNVLPYIDQQVLYNVGLDSHDPKKSQSQRDLDKKKNLATMTATPIALFVCPSRRRAQAWPYIRTYDYYNCDRPTVQGRSDYAANGGAGALSSDDPGPTTLADGDNNKYAWTRTKERGVCVQRGEIRAADIRDGASNTYMLGERYLNPDHYTTGDGSSDDQNLYIGYDMDNIVSGYAKFDKSNQFVSGYQPSQDESGTDHYFYFGSAHSAGFNVVFCDGSTRLINYSIDPLTHMLLADPADGGTVDGSKY